MMIMETIPEEDESKECDQTVDDIALRSTDGNKNEKNDEKEKNKSESKSGISMFAKIIGSIVQYFAFNAYLGSKLSNETSEGWRIADTVMLIVYNGVMLILVFCCFGVTCCALISMLKTKLLVKSQSKTPKVDDNINVPKILCQNSDTKSESVSIPMQSIDVKTKL